MSKNEPSLCMNNCLSKSQQNHRGYLFLVSMLNKISVSENVSHIMKYVRIYHLQCEGARLLCPVMTSMIHLLFWGVPLQVRFWFFIAVFNHIMYTCMGQWGNCSQINQSIKSFSCMHCYSGAVWDKAYSVMGAWRLPSHSFSSLLGGGLVV